MLTFILRSDGTDSSFCNFSIVIRADKFEGYNCIVVFNIKTNTAFYTFQPFLRSHRTRGHLDIPVLMLFKCFHTQIREFLSMINQEFFVTDFNFVFHIFVDKVLWDILFLSRKRPKKTSYLFLPVFSTFSQSFHRFHQSLVIRSSPHRYPHVISSLKCLLCPAILY